MNHQMQVVNPQDPKDFTKIEFSIAELKRLYNIILRDCEEKEKNGYTSDKINNLRDKLKYYIDGE